ncbi:MAG: SPASM domain-containing protein, partial [Spirochaetota bacterium]
ITDEKAKELKDAGLSYAGISIDGGEVNHDRMRNTKGSFLQSLIGLKNSMNSGLRCGIRFTVTRENIADVPEIFTIARMYGIDRICFYHLVYSGRGKQIRDMDLSLSEKRILVDAIIDATAKEHADGNLIEVLTVDNHCDGIFLYKRMRREKSPHAAAVLNLLQKQGATGTGIGIGCIGWDGTVYPDQFWRSRPLGTIRERTFSDIWSSSSTELLRLLREKHAHVTGRCASCRYLDICGGNFRARAEAVHDDMWAPDPACYLTDEEIQIRP